MNERLAITDNNVINDLWNRAEHRVDCTCGLVQVGYRASWAISHAKGCPVTLMYEALMRRKFDLLAEEELP